MPISIVEVAEKLKLAPSTISTVLNNRASTVRVSQKTRERIIKAARELGYEPNAIAKSLRLRKTFTIGLVDNANPPLPNMLQEIERQVSDRGYELLIALGRFQLQHEQTTLERLLGRKVDGLLILAPAIEPGVRDALESLSKTQFPIVGIGPLMTEGVAGVDWNRAEAFFNLTRHLLERGCRNVVFLGGSATPGRLARWAGMRRAVAECRDAGAAWLSLPDSPGLAPDDLIGFLRARLGEKHPDAIICNSDYLALAVLRLAQEQGWRVPQDLAVTGGSDTDWSAMIAPALTTVRMPIAEMAQRAAKRLFARIDKQADAALAPMELVPAEIIVRKSSLFGKG